MSNHDTYHQTPGLSSSMLKSMSSGWADFEAEYITRTKKRSETAAMKLGSLIHSVILEPETLTTKYAVAPARTEQHVDTVEELKGLCEYLQIKPLSKWKKADYIAAIVAANPEMQSDIWTCVIEDWQQVTSGKIVVSSDDYTTACRVLDNIENNSEAMSYLRRAAYREHQLYWVDDVTGMACKALCDVLCDDGVIPDIKTTKSAKHGLFASDAAKLGYHLQAAHYLAGAEAKGIDDPLFVFIAVEPDEPYRVRCYRYDADSLRWAADRRTDLMADYQRRLASGDWSEYGQETTTLLSLPGWMTNAKGLTNE